MFPLSVPFKKKYLFFLTFFFPLFAARSWFFLGCKVWIFWMGFQLFFFFFNPFFVFLLPKIKIWSFFLFLAREELFFLFFLSTLEKNFVFETLFPFLLREGERRREFYEKKKSKAKLEIFSLWCFWKVDVWKNPPVQAFLGFKKLILFW